MKGKVEISSSQEHKHLIQESQIQLAQAGVAINSHFIKYENVMMIGTSGGSALLCLKAEGQEDEDDGQIGSTVIQQLNAQQTGINIQGSLTVQIWCESRDEFVKEFKRLQQECIKEKPLEQILSSDEEDEDEEAMEQQMEIE
ncbi:unnamed protein product (macronuclear) [Paramecium tetraurelia]|uniref:Uncharacterized protein n=1 Tax=Paramecium tetraurelia TaxID=5888 RepID=A0D0G3_PARTE|nr:uncharacterized protein GSPATT00012082001 [Paramecium tetraurelia]CAK76530.1 unnamed protein product [Paramecium tetraurelia]|eukprot:XP_001443927.1 hypothetical protein (macronuclear) [Paramecium tetraurelia strain d4-2]